MKRKQITAIFLAMAIFIGMSIQALAVQAVYPTTASFLKVLDEEKVKYNYRGIDQDNNEEITLKYGGDNMDTIEADIFFDKDCDCVGLRVWDIIVYKEDDFVDVLKAINELNRAYRFVTFVADESDHTVYAAVDVPLRDCEEVGDIVYDALYYLIEITDEGYVELVQFDS